MVTAKPGEGTRLPYSAFISLFHVIQMFPNLLQKGVGLMWETHEISLTTVEVEG